MSWKMKWFRKSDTNKEPTIFGSIAAMEAYFESKKQLVVHQPPQDGVCIECLMPPINECYECDGLGWLEAIYSDDDTSDHVRTHNETSPLFLWCFMGAAFILCPCCDGLGVEQ